LEAKIKELLAKPSEYEWNYSVYIPDSINIQLETECIILDCEEFEDPDNPEPVLEKGYKYFMSVSQFQDVVSNIEQQDKSASLKQKLAGMEYYYKNDAFINL